MSTMRDFYSSEKETFKMMKIGKEVSYPRQLGDWIIVKTDSKKKSDL